MLFAYLRYFLLCRAVSSIALGMLILNEGVGRGGGLCGFVSRGGSRNLNKPNVMINKIGLGSYKAERYWVFMCGLVQW